MLRVSCEGPYTTDYRDPILAKSHPRVGGTLASDSDFFLLLAHTLLGLRVRDYSFLQEGRSAFGLLWKLGKSQNAMMLEAEVTGRV